MLLLRPIPRQKSLLIPRTPKRTFKLSCRLQNDANSTSPLAGKRCIITGASRGIGAEIARRFAHEGARCLLIGRNEKLLEKVRSGLGKVGEEHIILVGDVGDGELWGQLRKEVSVGLLSIY
jgi:short-subunit dehydrogenase